ncbi:MAG: LysE family transporter, partial [Candidatus Polarisedimenticolia bacterium]
AGRGPFAAGALITLLNPMSIASWIGILGAELAGRPRAGLLEELLFVAAICCGLMLWVAALAAVLHQGRRFAGGRGLRAVTLAAGFSLIGFGAHFALKALEAIGE